MARLVVAFVLAVAFAAPAAAQERSSLIVPSIAYITAQSLDLHSTHRARSNGTGREANPLMNVSTGGQIAIKAATTAGIVYAAHQVAKRNHPKLAKGMLWTASAFTFTVATRNYRIAAR